MAKRTEHTRIKDQGEQGFEGSYLAGTGFLGVMVELTLGGGQGDSTRRLANPGSSSTSWRSTVIVYRDVYEVLGDLLRGECDANPCTSLRR